MHNATLRQLKEQIDAYLQEHPEHADLPVYVPYDSQMAMTTVYGGITYHPADDDDPDPYIIIEGDS